jgi:hypothetical protein
VSSWSGHTVTANGRGEWSRRIAELECKGYWRNASPATPTPPTAPRSTIRRAERFGPPRREPAASLTSREKKESAPDIDWANKRRCSRGKPAAPYKKSGHHPHPVTTDTVVELTTWYLVAPPKLVQVQCHSWQSLDFASKRCNQSGLWNEHQAPSKLAVRRLGRFYSNRSISLCRKFTVFPKGRLLSDLFSGQVRQSLLGWRCVREEGLDERTSPCYCVITSRS